MTEHLLKKYNRGRSVYGTIFVISSLLNLCQNHLLISPLNHQYADMQGYITRALRIAEGAPREAFDLFYPPGTSYLYAIFFVIFSKQLALELITIAQALALAAANVLIGLTSEILFRKQNFGFLVAGLATIYWPFATFGSFFLAEPFFIFLFLFGQYQAAKVIFRKGNWRTCFLSGVSFGWAVLVKTQGMLGLLSVFFLLAWQTVQYRGRNSFRSHRARSAVPWLFVGALLVLIPQFINNTALTGKPSLYVAANDAFNTYLGQSRRQAIGCLGPEKGEFYVFYNNNSSQEELFLPIQILPVSIMERSYFFRQARELWEKHPARQMLRSLQNVVELFTIRPAWPLKNAPGFEEIDLYVQVVGCFFLTFPAIIMLVRALLFRCGRQVALFLFFPVFGMAAIAFLSTGQPRYLVPFYYNMLPWSILFYQRTFFWWRSGKTKKMFRELGWGVECICFLFLLGYGVQRIYRTQVPPRLDGPQYDYVTLEHLTPPIDTHRPVGWYEFGKDNQLLKEKLHGEGVYVDIFSFVLSQPSVRKVNWGIEAPQSGSFKLRFSPETFTHVAFYLTDPDSFWRASHIKSGTDIRIAQGLHDGKWISLEITPEERALGQKQIRMQRLAGKTISVAAVLFYNAISSESKPIQDLKNEDL